MKMKNDSRVSLARNFVALAGAAAALAMALGIAGCDIGGPGPRVHTGEMQTENLAVPMSGGTKSVRVHLEMAAGQINVSGGSSKLMEGTITYNVPEWKPDMSYSVNDGQGSLMVMQPEQHFATMGGPKYEWDLHFNNKVPLEMNVKMGAGDQKLDLADLTLRNLDVEVGAGNATIDLTGGWKQDVSADIQGGVGEVHVRLPRDIGVRVTVEGGLGSIEAPDFKRDGNDYVNDATGKSKNTIEVHISGGIGKVYLELGESHTVV